jgi:hypothetical protein
LQARPKGGTGIGGSLPVFPLGRERTGAFAHFIPRTPSCQAVLIIGAAGRLEGRPE